MSLQVESISIEQVFLGQLSVPIYQRDYAWGIAQVKDLWEDLLDFYRDEQDEYLLGQVIIAPGDIAKNIVDGQQRLTTMSLLLAAIRRRFDAATDINFSNRLTNLLGDAKAPRLEVARDASISYTAILNNEHLYQNRTISGSNLVENYQTLSTFLADYFPDAEELKDFALCIIERVKLVSVEMSHDDQAIEFFERTNDRGLDLNSADLLKNLLFAEVREPNFYATVNESWAKAVSLIRQSPVRKASSMEFLMKAKISAKLGKHVSNREVFRLWKQSLKGNKEAVLTLIRDLPRDASNLLSITSNKLPMDSESKDGLDSLKRLGMFQQYQLLLAGSHLSAESYFELCRIVRARFLLSIFSRERNGELEAGLTPWAKQLASLPADASRTDHIIAAKSSLVAVDTLLSMVPSLLDQLSYAGGASEQNKMRAALAIAACAIDTVGSDLAGAESYSNFDKYMSTQFDIEHITPQSTAQRMSWASPDELKFIDSLGNLTLLHRTPNRSNGDSEPKAKASSYAVSEILMTKILCDFSLIGDLSHELSEELSNKNVADPKRLDFWGEASARQRHYYLTEKITGLLKGELSG